MEDVTGELHELLHWAESAGVPLDGLEVVRPSLEDVYLSLTRATAEAGNGSPPKHKRWRG